MNMNNINVSNNLSQQPPQTISSPRIMMCSPRAPDRPSNNPNNELYEYIPVRFSISCILFERAFLLRHYGFSSPGPRVSINIQGKIRNTPLIWGSVIQVDGDSINFYVDNEKHARILALDSFAGHLSYYPQQEVMLRWYLNNKHRLLEDLKE
jgi:hypothetical protein